MWDVIVVGAGPAGLNTAKICSDYGLSVVVLEEHKKIGRPVQCSGLVSKRLSKLIKIKNSFIEHKVNGARLHSPNGKIVTIRKNSAAAYVINRSKFDVYLAKTAKKEGATILTNRKVQGIKIADKLASIKTNNGEFRAKIIVGCDGPNSIVARKINSKPEHLLTGMLALTKEKNTEKFVDLYFDNNLFPGFFAWKIPRKTTTEYGLAGQKTVSQSFKYFLRLNKAKNYKLNAGLIPMGFQKTFSERVLLVGDAASQGKPLTGGGVVYSLICSKIASSIIKSSIETNNQRAEFLSTYERLWHMKLKKDILFALWLRKLYRHLSNEQIEFFFSLINHKKIIDYINERGDMDFPFTAAFKDY